MVRYLASLLLSLALFCSQASAGFLINSYAFSVPPSVTFITSSSQASGTTATYTGISIGTAAADRMIVVVSGQRVASPPTSITIDGNAMTLFSSATSASQSVTIGYLPWPTGTTANIVITWSGSAQNSMGIYAVYLGSASATPTDTDSNTSTSSPLSITGLTVPTNGVAIIGTSNNTNSATSWTNATVGFNLIMSSSNRHTSGASTTTAGTNTITGTTTTSGYAMAGVAWGY